MRKTEKTIAGQTKVVLEVSVFDDDDIEEIKHRCTRGTNKIK